MTRAVWVLRKEEFDNGPLKLPSEDDSRRRVRNSSLFCAYLSKEGTFLIDCDPDVRTDLIEFVVLKYRERAEILAETSI